MKSLRWRVAGWFAFSVLAVMGVFITVTHLHLQRELRLEQWERAQPGHANWALHGSYTETEVDDIAGELWHLSLLYALPVALLALGVGYLLAHRAFAPVAEMNRQLQVIGARSLTSRVRLAQADREFRAIEASINALLARLEASFGQLTEYSAQVAHELRTPLTLLRLQVEDAAGRIEPALAESLQEELRRLSDYVDQSLLLATAEQGRLALKLEPVALVPLLEEMLEAYERLARTANRSITFTARDEVTVTTDRRYLRQVFHTLFTNALRHGSGSIKVAVSRTAAGSHCRFENACAPTAPEPRGHGLGLRLARAISGSLGCTFKGGPAGGIFVAELRWPATAP